MPYEEYLSIVGSLLHICNVTRSDCMFAVGFLARHGSRPSLNHFEAAKNVVAFLYNTKHRAVQYVRDASMAKGRIPYASQDLANRLRMFVDADFARTVASQPGLPPLERASTRGAATMHYMSIAL